MHDLYKLSFLVAKDPGPDMGVRPTSVCEGKRDLNLGIDDLPT
jgi:hypothetical protein